MSKVTELAQVVLLCADLEVTIRSYEKIDRLSDRQRQNARTAKFCRARLANEEARLIEEIKAEEMAEEIAKTAFKGE